jgi:hypothetical protein
MSDETAPVELLFSDEFKAHLRSQIKALYSISNETR